MEITSTTQGESRFTLDDLAKLLTDHIKDSQERFDFIKENMVMKKEFYQEIASIRAEMATKEDLKEFAKKEDLKDFVKKEDIGRLRSDLIDFIDKKFLALTNVLIQKDVVTAQDVQAVFGVDSLPQVA